MYYMICSLRIPEILQARIDSAAGSDGRSKWIIEACRMRLDGSVGVVATPSVSKTESAGSSPAAPAKPDRQALQDICDGKLPITSAAPYDVEKAEIPICGKTWWEDGTQYECFMDKGHKEQKHGLRGMVSRLEY